jgi:hypothetical protein
MTNLQHQLRPLLSQFHNATGRGNLIFANSTLATIIKLMAEKIDAPCACGTRSVQVTLESAEPFIVIEEVVTEDVIEDVIEAVVEPVRRSRGRPRKVRT